MRRYLVHVLIVFVCSGFMCCLSSCDNPEAPPASSSGISSTEVSRSEQNRKMDMIMWYDCDGWVSSISLAENRDERPTVPCRVSDTYMGSYSALTEKIALQHAYWISSLGCNVICCDWTNYISYRQPGNDFSYNKRIYSNTTKLLAAMKETDLFTTPSLYVAIRLSDYRNEELQMKLDDVYKLYEEYKDQWYYFDDGTENAAKPFIVIFTDVFFTGDKWYDRLHNTWHEADEISLCEDSRFNIRWSNGYLGVTAKEDEKGWYEIPGSSPYWTFVEPYIDEKAGEGYYDVMYSVGTNGQVEQMSCWASMFAENQYWDPLNNVIDGKTTFERTLRGVAELQPKALLVNRFNYPLAWPDQPQEGLSLYESTHIEPNNDFGFLVFDNVQSNLYTLNNWIKAAPPAPEFTVSDSNISILEALKNDAAGVYLQLKGEPQMYRISASSDMANAEYIYYDLSKGILLPEELENHDGPIYVQTKNAFGESEIVTIK